MKNFKILFTLFLLINFSLNAQWKNRYPKVNGYGHHVYLEGYELPVLNSGPTDPAPSPLNNQVVFSAKGWLWIMNLETQEAKRITFSSGMDFSPNWSPDGSKIVFVRDNSMDTSIVLLDLNTKKETVLVNSEALDLNPIFSTNGKDVYYASAKNGSLDLWKINLTSLEKSVLTNDNGLERLPVPTKEGNLVYLRKNGFSYDSIELLDLDKETSNALIEENFTSQASFSLSNDDKTLVYTWPNGDDYELKLLNITVPKSKMLLTKSKGLPLSPKFSFDGKWVYFSENNKNEVSELKRITIYGGKVETLDIKKWNWGTVTGKLKIISRVDEKIEAVRMNIIDQNGHPIIPNTGLVHSEGQNGIVFFYSPGEIEIEAPLGTLTITSVHGFSTVKTTKTIIFETDNTTTEIDLNRIWNAKKDGWYAADAHFHLNYGGTSQLEPEDILLDLKAEEIDIAFPLLANLGNRFLEEDLFNFKHESLPIVSIGQETRSHFLGHLNLLGTKEVYWPWVWGPYYDIYDKEDRPNAEPLRFAHKQGGIGGYVHPVSIKNPFQENGGYYIPTGLVADAIMEDVDILELGCLWSDEIGTAALWHEFLNIGIPLALSAGSDVMNDLYRTMAIGATRVYAKPEGELTVVNYLEALKKGKSFMTNGPQLLFTVENFEVGDAIKTKKSKANWKLEVHSPVPYDKVEIFVNGDIVDTKKSKNGTSKTYTGKIEIPKGGWITARVYGSKSVWPMMDSYTFAESSPIWFNSIGSTMPNTKINAAKKLLELLEFSEKTIKQSYRKSKTPNLMEHSAKARAKLMDMISKNKI
ncbi:CehA/McbA family metallohydrolase [Thalassobellus sediminis]|uniref:CehA/McbA family metallohydrolase n=1 Tax=Thalassobellus sediminis TaxID=3367753 RepID=UPI00378A505E